MADSVKALPDEPVRKYPRGCDKCNGRGVWLPSQTQAISIVSTPSAMLQCSYCHGTGLVYPRDT
jgi:DnaJ-class molecular chaperone